MSLFCSIRKFPILCPNFQIKHGLQSPVSSRNCSLKSPDIDISGTSLYSRVESINCPVLNVKCTPNSSSPGDSGEVVPSSSIIFIKGAARSTSIGGLKTAFSRFGEVSRVKIISDKKTKQSLGFAYVWFTKEEHAEAAVEEMNGKFFEGRFISVDIARPESCKPRAKFGVYKF